MMSSSFSFLVDKYIHLGKEDPIINNFYCDYIIRNYPDLVKVVSFDEFISNINKGDRTQIRREVE